MTTTHIDSTDTVYPHWRKHDGEWMVCGDAEQMVAGVEVTVVRKDGTTQTVTLAEVGPAERDYEGNMVCYATVVATIRPATVKQLGLLAYLADKLEQAGQPDLAIDCEEAADSGTTMDRAHELIDQAKAALGESGG